MNELKDPAKNNNNSSSSSCNNNNKNLSDLLTRDSQYYMDFQPNIEKKNSFEMRHIEAVQTVPAIVKYDYFV